MLSEGTFSVYGKKSDADGKKPPKHSVELRVCPRVSCSDIKSFNIVLPSVQPKGSKERRR